MKSKSVKKTDVLHPDFKKNIHETFKEMSHKQKKHISDLYDLATLDEKPGLQQQIL